MGSIARPFKSESKNPSKTGGHGNMGNMEARAGVVSIARSFKSESKNPCKQSLVRGKSLLCFAELRFAQFCLALLGSALLSFA